MADQDHTQKLCPPEHASILSGPRISRVYGTGATDVCGSCGAWRRAWNVASGWADATRQLRAKRLQRVGNQHGSEKLAAFGRRAVGASDEVSGKARIASREHPSGETARIVHGLCLVWR